MRLLESVESYGGMKGTFQKRREADKSRMDWDPFTTNIWGNWCYRDTD